MLRGIDLHIGRGDEVALAVPMVPVKTTRIRCLLGEYNCNGDVTVDSLDPRQYRTDVLKRVGFVPQIHLL